METAMKELKSAAVTILFRLYPDALRMTLRPGLGFRSQANRCTNWLISTFDTAPPPICESAYLDEKVRNVGCRRLACDMTRTFRARLFEFFRSRGQAWW